MAKSRVAIQWIPLVLLILVMNSGCQLAGIQFKRLVAEKNFVEASEVYVKNRQFFKEDKTGEHIAQLKLVADELNQARNNKLAAKLEQVNAQTWPTIQEKWSTIRNAIVDASEVLADYNKSEFLSEPEFRSILAVELGQALSKLSEAIKSSAIESFASYNHFGKTSFFTTFPVSMESKGFMGQNFPALLPRLRTAKASDLQQFLKLYPKGDFLDQVAFTTISNQFVKAYWSEDSQGKKPPFSSVVQALITAQVAGFKPTALEGLRIGAFQVKRSDSKEWMGAFPVDFGIDVPVTPLEGDLESILSGEQLHSFDYVVLIDFVLASANHKVENVETVKSKYVAGYRSEPNPEYLMAQNNVATARSNLTRVTIENLDTCQNCAPLVALFHSLGQAFSKAAAEKQLNDAITALASISPTLRIPEYQDYTFRKSTVDSKKLAIINCFTVDVSERTFVKYTFAADEVKKSTILYQLNENDSNRNTLAAGTVGEKEIADWEQTGMTVMLSDMFSYYVKAGGEKQVVLPITMMTNQVSDERNRILAEKKSILVDAAQAKTTDSRFQKVVVMYNRQKSKLGTGFFVRPDVILTNYHVVEDATYVEMKTHSGEETFGKVIKYDARLDLALIRVQSRGDPVEIYTGPEIRLGSSVEAIGHPESLEFSLTRGVVSAIRKRPSPVAPGTGDVLTIQTDTTLNHGNSGGPLFLEDKVIGVVSYRRSSTQEGLNFVIHYAEVKQFLDEHLP